ncbi:hypothetical protein G7074_21555 [Pedobacter sp. HDW13]|uniref:hypothetical protein n=1 Tax=Pedobacter sp. HDW13 TaxID=2714940 RepID=UPI00140AB753|nr:hypothetical protein [Pedobacter sp. HDW13]QIL41621.1 hypothetical protein G7074_21555 [Pedobacter sp. HDW13]
MQDDWRQLSGEGLSRELVRGAGAFIERNYYGSAPLQIRNRWPSIIGSVEKKSDSEITIICKPQVNISTFRTIFCKHVSRLFTQEINMELRVYSYNFTQDFSYRLEVKGRRWGVFPLSVFQFCSFIRFGNKKKFWSIHFNFCEQIQAGLLFF